MKSTTQITLERPGSNEMHPLQWTIDRVGLGIKELLVQCMHSTIYKEECEKLKIVK